MPYLEVNVVTEEGTAYLSFELEEYYDNGFYYYDSGSASLAEVWFEPYEDDLREGDPSPADDLELLFTCLPAQVFDGVIEKLYSRADWEEGRGWVELKLDDLVKHITDVLFRQEHDELDMKIWADPESLDYLMKLLNNYPETELARMVHDKVVDVQQLVGELYEKAGKYEGVEVCDINFKLFFKTDEVKHAVMQFLRERGWWNDIDLMLARTPER